MARKLLTVDDTFYIEGRGLCLVPFLIPQDDEVFHHGDFIDIKFLDGRVTHTKIHDLNLPTPNPDYGWVIMLSPSFKKGDVPIGTEIWSVDS